MKKFLLLVVGVSLNMAQSAQATTATGLSSFDAIEETLVRFVPATNSLEPDRAGFVNIIDAGDNIFRMTLRYSSTEWDGDRDTPNRDRQRAEVKGLGVHQKHGETFAYTTTWRTNESFVGSGRFCHIFQLKATDGDSGSPLVTLSVQRGTEGVSFEANPSGPKIIARKFPWKPAVWQTVRMRIKTSPTANGELAASIDGDEFRGAENVELSRPGSSEYRPKWGLYRGARPDMPIGDDYVEHRDVSAQQVGAAVVDNAPLESEARRKAKETTPSAALAWLQAKAPSPARDFAIGSIAAYWAESDPASAMAWAETLPADDLRQDAVLRIFNRWSDHDITKAMAWLVARAPNPELNDLVWYLATDTTFRYVNRPVALQAAPLITDAERRAAAIEHVIEIWSRREREAALKYVSESSVLSEAQKGAIVQRLSRRRWAE